MTFENDTTWALLTDLYELTMAQSYVQEGMFQQATFSLFTRTLPANRSYIVCSGLESVLTYLANVHFSSEDIRYLQSTELFNSEFLDYLYNFRFTGEVWAIPEGCLGFAEEPLAEVTAPVPEAQIIESFLINQINFQSTIATKAARCVWAAEGRPVVDFSLRRTHGIDAALKAARSSYIAGCESTSNVLAGKWYEIPITGTMAHSFITSFSDEIESFRAYARSFPDDTVLLIDTYDTLTGVRNAIVVAKEMENSGHRLRAVRLDSGDLLGLSKQVRAILDGEGLDYVRILASGGLDEYRLEDLIKTGATIDGFGVGTRMGVSSDAPYFDMAYKLVEFGGRSVLKLSTGKTSLVNPKQVYRCTDSGGQFSNDVLALRNEPAPAVGKPLLEKVMDAGGIIAPLPTLNETRARFKKEFSLLPQKFKKLQNPPEYPVVLSRRLQELQNQTEQRTADANIGFSAGGVYN